MRCDATAGLSVACVSCLPAILLGLPRQLISSVCCAVDPRGTGKDDECAVDSDGTFIARAKENE